MEQTKISSENDEPAWLAEFKSLYRDSRLRSTISRYVLGHGGTAEAARDLLQDTFVVLYQHLAAGHFRGDSSLYTYCVGIARQLWFNHQRRELRSVPYPDALLPQADPTLSERDALRIDVLKHLLETRLDAPMRDLLTLYSLGLSFREIAQRHGNLSADAAKQRIYRCLERLLRLLQTHPDLKEG